MKHKRRSHKGIGGLIPKPSAKNFTTELAYSALSVAGGMATTGLVHLTYNKLAEKLSTTAPDKKYDAEGNEIKGLGAIMDTISSAISTKGNIIKPVLTALAGAGVIAFSKNKNLQLFGAGMVGQTLLKEGFKLVKVNPFNVAGLGEPIPQLPNDYLQDMAVKYAIEQNTTNVNSARSSSVVASRGDNRVGYIAPNANAAGSGMGYVNNAANVVMNAYRA